MVLKHQLDLMASIDCDVWLLTEVPYTFRTVMVPGSTVLAGPMDPTHKAFAAVWAKAGIERELAPIHEAAAYAQVGGRRVCSCLLPTRTMPGAQWPDPNYDRAAIMPAAIERLRTGFARDRGELIWGGTWQHPLAGEDREDADDRAALSRLVDALDVQVPTAALPHADGDGTCSIDHIAVPAGWTVAAASRIVATLDGGDQRLSPHDAYVVEVEA